jgi:hypothetical protein
LIKVWDAWSGLMPLLLVIAIGMIREAIEDVMRYQSDRKTNATPVKALRDGALVDIKSD